MFLAAALLATAAPAAPATRVITPEAASAPEDLAGALWLPIAPDDYERLTVAVRIGGNGPFRFLVDTGADRSAVSGALARRLGLAVVARARLHSATGVSSVPLVRVRDLGLETRVIPSLELAVLAAADMGADGILGIDALRAQRIVIDLQAGRIYLARSTPREPRPASDEIVVTGQVRHGYLILAEARIDDEPVTIVLDTGAELSIGNRALLGLLGRRARLGPPVAAQQTSVTGELLIGQTQVVERLAIGDAELRQVAIMFADAETFRVIGRRNKPTLLLGMNAFRAFRQVAIDLGSRRLRLRLPGR